ncbi:MAG: Daunorubicin/doxorubicin resistance ATP-binding protein DrrA [Candidatus Accumulibacter sp. SK-11]|nr:MAG: Daunorubicin/doxorubicin resistance ATP-binding protein DrrA [Candidatus Accumulibacter sp. SK-11]
MLIGQAGGFTGAAQRIPVRGGRRIGGGLRQSCAQVCGRLGLSPETADNVWESAAQPVENCRRAASGKGTARLLKFWAATAGLSGQGGTGDGHCPGSPGSAIVAAMQTIIAVAGLCKTYASGFQALRSVSLDIRHGEIFALLGPNGAGKTTLISIICGIVRASSGNVRVGGHDIVADYRAARSMIGLVPQELTTDAFESVWTTVSFSRGLFGKRANPQYLEKLLRDLSLWDRKDSRIRTLSGGMKRRLLIAKALSHEPQILFLDEPTAGVDVNLRRDMWQLVRALKATGVTIILTTHYIDEAEEMADRIGVISKGELILVEEKAELMRKLGRKQLTLQLQQPLQQIPPALAAYRLDLSRDGSELTYTYDTQGERSGILALLEELSAAGIAFRDLHTTQSSLEEIFVSLVKEGQ